MRVFFMNANVFVGYFDLQRYNPFI
uniref:Uncharacterized protein n=1 Tax=Lepeophtheirus salmonis TaxID=72036 RepID=A0A0K2SW05_LEPSM